jgi:hypothetical protein
MPGVTSGGLRELGVRAQSTTPNSLTQENRCSLDRGCITAYSGRPAHIGEGKRRGAECRVASVRAGSI